MSEKNISYTAELILKQHIEQPLSKHTQDKLQETKEALLETGEQLAVLANQIKGYRERLDGR